MRQKKIWLSFFLACFSVSCDCQAPRDALAILANIEPAWSGLKTALAGANAERASDSCAEIRKQTILLKDLADRTWGGLKTVAFELEVQKRVDREAAEI